MDRLYSLVVRSTSNHKVGIGMGPTFTAKLSPGLREWGQSAGLGRQRQEDFKFEDSLDYTVRYTSKDKTNNQPSFYHEVRLLSLVHLCSLLCNLGQGWGGVGEGRVRGDITYSRACCAAEASMFLAHCTTGVFSTQEAHGGAEQKECWIWKAGRVNVPWVDGPGGTPVFTQRFPPRRPHWSWRNRRSSRREAAFGSSSSDAWGQGKDGHLGHRVGIGVGRGHRSWALTFPTGSPSV